MNAFLENPVWGISQEAAHATDQLPDHDEAVPIIPRLRLFLARQIERWNPDKLIVIERKGTALLRSLKEAEDEPLQFPWTSVLSSNSFDQVDPKELRGKRILIFDDMMKQGAHVAELLDKLHMTGVWNPALNNVSVAIFAVHEQSSRGREKHGLTFPGAWFYRDLTDLNYQRLRAQIVAHLQRSGSLMLDTEHIEVRIRLKGNFNQLVKALCRRATPVVFQSAAQRTNITVVYGDDPAHEISLSELPDQIRGKTVIKKCRIVQRTGNEFAIIPICFPSIPVSLAEWPNAQPLKDLLGPCLFVNDTSRFYGVGLSAAFQVLHWVLRDLAAARDLDFTLSLPNKAEHDATSGGYSLDHLKVMYPTIDTAMVNQRISDIAAIATTQGHELRSVRSVEYTQPVFTSSDLRKKALALLQRITQTLDQRRTDRWLAGGQMHKHPCGLSAAEIFQIGSDMGWERPLTSTLFDILIDEATLVTHVEEIADTAGGKLISRTFEPDGEIVAESIRRYTSQWGVRPE